MIRIDSKTLKQVIATRKVEVEQKIRDSVHPDEGERVVLNPGYIANSVADLKALDEMLEWTLHLERLEAEG
jgi:hypothetical protein